MKKVIFALFVGAFMIACSNTNSDESNASVPAVQSEVNASAPVVEGVAVVEEGVVVVGKTNQTAPQADEVVAVAEEPVVEANQTAPQADEVAAQKPTTETNQAAN